MSRNIVDSLGRSRHHNGIIIKQRLSKNGYLYCKLWKNQEYKTVKPHRLVALHFIYNFDPINKDEVNHIDGIKTNNVETNLEWVTQAENINHYFETSLPCRKGERNNSNTITEKEALSLFAQVVGRKL